MNKWETSTNVHKEPWYRNFMIIILSGFAFFTIEFFVKNSMLNGMGNGEHSFFGLFDFNFVANANGAFSLPINQVLIVILAFGILLGLIQYFTVCCRDGLYGHVWALSFIIWAAFSNVYDRITRGFVIDYIDISIWPIFNLSDLVILIGCISLIVLISRHEKAEALKLHIAV